ncbi:hypothetical protein VTK73DRAFT_1224 [Phialemonium thermophilum]|uniref:Diphthine--ammonia ligase n=1 Tax=Phialemonium thermophilum TaxID=223376 RepID=A0ABR3Y3V4_9PEZI
MYQTVGHQVIPLYADLTNTPVYRRPISGSATQTGKEYSHAAHYLRPSDVEVQGDSSSDGQSEETESMIPLLSAVMQAHPEANAICAGAILSTYQRTRVESVAVRLGLIPLAFLWKYPVLPCPSGAHDESQLLVDLAAAGLEARIIKIASGGLDESFLWENVASPRGIARLRKAMRRFGVSETGAILGEGGEFETLVVGGPPSLFGGRIVVDPADRHVVHEGGGSAWLNLRHARVEKKATEQKQSGTVRVPDLLDTKFADILQKIASSEGERFSGYTHDQLKDLGSLGLPVFETASTLQWWCLTGVGSGSHSIEAETGSLINQIKVKLREATLRTSSILNTFILLRNMSDFSVVNQIYGSLFDEPNPPSRVSISGGDLLPQGCNIAIYLSVHIGLDWPGSERRGLHVQSRSYWAPANIGPYSQAISVPLSGLGHISGTSLPVGELVHVAGQIPLVPAKMELPPSRGEPMADFCVQAVLSLQHLWRIGAEMGVQWWMSAVAYLPRAGRELKERVPTAQRAMLVTRAWEAAHRWPPEGTSHNSDSSDGEIESNIDLWDRKYNLQSSMLAKPPAPEAKHDLPDGSVLDESYSSESRSIPAVFVAEVDELPRGAGVEWHAHAGLAHLDPSISVLVTDCSTATLRDGSVARVQHTIVRPRPDRPENAAPGAFVHSVVAIPLSASSACGGSTSSLRNLLEEIGNLVLRFTSGPSASATAQGPRCPTLL